MRTSPLNPQFHGSNRKRFADVIGEDAMAIIDTADVLTRSGDFEYPFRPDSNFYYLTGIDEPESVLLLMPGHSNPDYREMLFISGTSEFIGTWEGARLTPGEATKLSGITSVRSLSDLPFFLDRALPKFQKIYLNANESLESHMSSPSLRRAREFGERMPTHEIRSALPTLNRLRIIKDPAEIDQMREAIEITIQGLIRTGGALKPGIREYELEAELTAEFIRHGAGHAFMPIVASGKNTTTMHHMKSDALIGDSDLVLMDVGAELGWYCADISRVFPSSGSFSPRQRQLYEAVLRVQRAAITRYRPGASIMSIDIEMRHDLTHELVGLGILTEQQAESKDSERLLRKYYAHISHHLGLDVHDTGDSWVKFEPGMVVTCEPGLYLKEEGIGVRLEDDILITDTGCEVLTRSMPILPDEIEALMQKEKS